MVILSNETDDDSSLHEALEEIDNKWHLGSDKERDWRYAVLNEVPFLFSVSAEESATDTGIFFVFGISMDDSYYSTLLSVLLYSINSCFREIRCIIQISSAQSSRRL